MKIWKLVSGILSLVLSVFVIFQSGAAGLSNALEENNEVGGSAGFFVALFLIAGGIISIVTRNSTRKAGNIVLIILFGLGALIGFGLAGSYSDLQIWAGWCAICAIISIIALFVKRKDMQ